MHTPGPWRVSGCRMRTLSECDNYLVEHGDEQERSPLIAEIFTDDSRLPVEANARLIAAAPKLLEALEGLVDAGEKLNLDFDLTEARSAITAAKGE